MTIAAPITGLGRLQSNQPVNTVKVAPIISLNPTANAGTSTSSGSSTNPIASVGQGVVNGISTLVRGIGPAAGPLTFSSGPSNGTPLTQQPASGVGAVNQAASPTVTAANPGTSYGLQTNINDFGVPTPTVFQANSPVPAATTAATPAAAAGLSSLFGGSSGNVLLLVVVFLIALMILK